MGKRTRKRSSTARESRSQPVAQPATRPRSRRARLDEAPAAPWAPFPLTELLILLSIGMLVAGALTGGSRRGVLLAGGVVLVSLSSLELSIREHLAGYRSHSSLLAGAAGVASMVAVALLSGAPRYIDVVVGLAVFLVVLHMLRELFKRRSGGLGFRA